MTGVPQTLPLEQLQPDPLNPRGVIDDASLGELVESIRTQGLLTPLLVRGDGSLDGLYTIVAGHRRYRAAQLVGLTEIPVVVVDATDVEAREMAIVENLQREDIRPLDEARAFQALLEGQHTPSSIASRVGKPERYIWDRVRLLQLVPAAAMLLDTERITVQHAIVLAKLKPADQARIIDPTATRGRGLFEGEQGLWDKAAEGREPGKWDGLKPVSVRELQRNIATFVRFDVQQAATAAPLDFGPVAEQVAAAEAQPKRGRKVVHITRDSYVQPEAKSDGDRIYTERTWKRADGLERSKPCDRAVLGVAVVGPGYGEAFLVCIHKDCDVHWKQERLDREKAAARVGGSRGKTTAREEADRKRDQARQAKEEAARKAWEVPR